MQKSFLLLAFSVLYNFTYAQTVGCTDYQATNFNNLATVNDGTCVYLFTPYTAVFKCNLDSSLVESSGLAHWQQIYYSHNDSDNPNLIYKLDTITGNILQKIKITNAINVDWEDICIANNKMYIADFGNNNNTRTNLGFYTINLPFAATDTIASAIFHQYYYPNQTNFSNNTNTLFDAEAMFFRNNELNIFSKQWGNNQTTWYTLQKDSAQQVAVIKDSFNCGGLITGADISTDGKTIALLGYETSGKSFIWLLWNFPNNNILKGNKRRIDLGYSTGQAEGIVFVNNNRLLLSTETYSIAKASLFSVDIEPYLKTVATILPKNSLSQTSFFYNQQANCLQGKFLFGDQIFIFSAEGKKVFTKIIKQNIETIILPILPAGIYKAISQNTTVTIVIP